MIPLTSRLAAWLQLRYTWADGGSSDTCVVKQTNASFNYAYEYLGAQGRLVVTPLTDRCAPPIDHPAVALPALPRVPRLAGLLALAPRGAARALAPASARARLLSVVPRVPSKVDPCCTL